MNLLRVRRAHARSLELPERDLFDAPELCGGLDRIDGRNHFRAGDRHPFSALNAQPNDDHLHSYCTRLATELTFFRTSSGDTGRFPSCSQATAAAMLPRIEA